MEAHIKSLVKGVLTAHLDPRDTHVGFNSISGQVCTIDVEKGEEMSGQWLSLKFAEPTFYETKTILLRIHAFQCQTLIYTTSLKIHASEGVLAKSSLEIKVDKRATLKQPISY